MSRQEGRDCVQVASIETAATVKLLQEPGAPICARERVACGGNDPDEGDVIISSVLSKPLVQFLEEGISGLGGHERRSVLIQPCPESLGIAETCVEAVGPEYELRVHREPL